MKTSKDLTGETFGMLKVIKEDFSKVSNKKHTYWQCVCDCGNIAIIVMHSLTSSNTTSCGCKKLNFVNVSGEKFGSLTAIKRLKIKHEEASWECLCDCGKKTKSSLHALKQGIKKSCRDCGFKRLHINNPLRAWEASARRAFSKGYREANITFDDFIQLSQMKCHYCNSNPSNKTNAFANNDKFSDFAKANGDFIYNGLDRVDNKLKHTKDNVVPCCFPCNKMKGTSSYEEFKCRVSKIYNHMLKDSNDK